MVKSTKTIIYVRHADDEKSSHHKFDERLVEEGKRKARHAAKKLIKAHGVPDVIYFSPMRRTRQTAKEFLKAVKHHQKHEEESSKVTRMEIEPRIGRLFTHKEQRRHDRHDGKYLRRSTKKVIMDDDKNAFRSRVEKQFKNISKVDKNEDRVIWNVTHSLVLLHVARINNVTRDKHVKYLDTLVLNS